MKSFSDRLADAVRRNASPVVVGLDPRADRLPPPLACDAAAGVCRLAEAYELFCREIIDVVAKSVAAVKPQSAFFEQLGPPGLAALHAVIEYARAKNVLVILDAKRGDIGSTAEAYAAAYLGQSSAWKADSLTVNPYLGGDSLAPFVAAAHQQQAGLFVLVKTSNPGSADFQDLPCEGRPLYRHVAARVEALAAEQLGECGYGSIGAVVGATHPEQLAELRQAMPHAWLLIPGYGAQGGGARDVASGFDAQGLGAVVNSSRAIIFAHQRPEYARFAPSDWQRAVEEATLAMREELTANN